MIKSLFKTSLIILLSSSQAMYATSFLKQPTTLGEKYTDLPETSIKMDMPENQIVKKDYIRKVNFDFQKITGISDEEYDKLLDKAMEDDFYKKAFKKYYGERRLAKNKNGKDIKNMVIPKYKEALALLYQSTVENKNIISAYEGLTIVTMLVYQNGFDSKSYLRAKDNKQYALYHDKYLGAFSNLLAENDLCYGYIYQVRHFSENGGDLEVSFTMAKKGLDACNKQFKEEKTPVYMYKGMRMTYAKLKALKIVKKAREKSKYNMSSKGVTNVEN